MTKQEANKLIEHWFESVEIAEYEYMICASQAEPFWIEVKQAINILQGKQMISKMYSNEDIELLCDLREDLYYLSIVDKCCVSDCTNDYTKQELVAILKDMINVLDN